MTTQITKDAIPQHKLQANKGSDKTFFFVSVSQSLSSFLPCFKM